MNIAKTSAILFTGTVLGAAIDFIGIVYFARELGASSIGVFFLFQSLVGILSVISDFGLRGAIEKRISEGRSPNTFLSSGILLKSASLTIVVFGIIVFQPAINSYLGSDAALLVASGVIVHEMAFLSNEVLRGELRVSETATLKIIQRTTWVILGLVLIYYGMNEVGLMYSYIMSFISMSLIGWYKISIPIGLPSKETFISLIKYAKYNFVESIGGVSYNWLAIAIIGFFLSSSHVGAYEVAWRVSTILVMISGVIGTVLFPKISHWHSNGKKAEITSAIQNVLTPTLGITIPGIIGTALLSNEILGIVFNEEYVIASAALIILVSEKLFRAAHDISGQTLEGINKPDLTAVASLIFLLTNIILSVVLVPNFGLVGAAVATTASSILSTTFQYFKLSQYISIQFPTDEILWCVVSALGMGGAIILVRPVIKIESLFRLLLIILIGVFVYLSLVSIYKPIRNTIIALVTNNLES